MATRESMTAEQFGKKLCTAYDQYSEHYEAGRLGDDALPPHEIVNQLTRANREANEKARDENNSGLGPKYLQNKAKPEAEDDEQPKKSANGNSGNGGATPAQDGAQDDMIRLSGVHDVPGALAAARARRADPAKVAAMAGAIPSYKRLK